VSDPSQPLHGPPPAPEPAPARKPPTGQRTWQVLRAALQLWLLLVVSNLGAMVYVRVSGDTSPWVDVTVTGIDATVIALFAMPHRSQLAVLLDPRRCGGRAIALAIVTTGIAGLVVTGWFWLAQHVFALVSMLESFREHEWPLWSAFVLTAVVPPVVEEIAFRGILLERLQRVMVAREAWLVQGVLFGFIHMSPAVFPSHIFLGLVLGWLRVRTGSLLPPMLMHALWNAWVLVEELWSGAW